MHRWDVPEYTIRELKGRTSKYCVCIPVINEGEKIRTQLSRMQDISQWIDVIIADGGSSDGSTDLDFLNTMGVRTLLIKTGDGKLSAQLRMAFAYAIEQGYDGVITVDGNNKDSVESIPDFAAALDQGYDFVQGSRFVEGGHAINTPKLRHIAVRYIHAPIISFLSHFPYTDTTNGFRGASKRLLCDPSIGLFRDVFQTYELLAYLSVQASTSGYSIREIPVTRTYPEKGRVPTKISPIRGNVKILIILLKLAIGMYNPPTYNK